MKDNAKNLLVAVLIVFLLIFLAQNTQVVSIQLLFWRLSMSRVILILLTTLFGVVLGYLWAKK